MPRIFGPNWNSLSKFSIVVVLGAVGGLLFLGDALQKSPYVTREKVTISQPVPFSHNHHVAGVGIDCRYCHTSVEEAAFAGIPPTSTCMNCHSQIWNEAPMLEPVRASYKNNTPIEWNRVHDLPDFVYFNHSIHISKGIGCTSCHGRVDQMPLMWKDKTLYMQWCLECHTNPEKYVRDAKDIYKMDWAPRADQISFGKKLLEERHIKNNIHCSTCHR